MTFICAWCPGFDPRAVSNTGASHGICPVCAVRMRAELDVLEVERAIEDAARARRVV